MKNLLFRSMLAVMFTAACFTPSYASHFERSVEGTWRTVVTPINCQTGVPVSAPFPGILTFSKGGTLTGTSATVTSAFGVWGAEKGSRSYTFAFTNLRYDPAGVVIGSQVVRQTLTLGESGDEFTSTGTVQFLNLSGTVVGSGCATSTGTRFE